MKPGVAGALALTLLCALATALWSASGRTLPTFTDVTDEAGISFKHSYGDHHLSNIVEGTGPGGGFLDYNNDGYLDIYLVNARWEREVNDNRGRNLRGKLFNALYRNNGDGTFTDVTKEAGVGHDGYGIGVSVADYDSDGDWDLYVLNYGPNVLYRNNGDGTFTNVAAEAGLDDPLWSLSAPWLDYDGDGDLDVYVANYLEYDAGAFRDYYAAEAYPGPLSYNGEPDHLYRNNGDGTFTDVTKEAGMLKPDGRAMSAVACDLNNDGLTDLYVTNDFMPNWCYINNGDGTFTERAVELGAAFGEGGQNASSMGPAIGDIDRNGFLDLFIPDMGYSCLLLNRGRFFIDVTAPANVAIVCGQYTGWGGGLLDYDNDGWLDLFVANGNAHHEYTEEDVLLRFDGRGHFVDVAVESGAYFHTKYVGRGAAFADWDNDGDVDILVVNLNDKPRLLRNDGGNTNNWLKVVPRLPSTGVEAIGARVSVTVGTMTMIDDVCSVRGYLSSSDPRPNFGLGRAAAADKVEIRWPGGLVQTFENVSANQVFEVVRPASEQASLPPTEGPATGAEQATLTGKNPGLRAARLVAVKE